MRLDWLELSGFRTYEDLRWEPDPGVNVLVGPNAVGKTNLLEGIAYLSTLKSFRGLPDTALIRATSDEAAVRGEVTRGDSSVLIEVSLPVEGRRRAQVNRQRLQRVADLLGHIRLVTFLPDDLDILKRGPAYRRDLLDDVAVQIWPGAHADQQEYDKALRQRNSLLRQMGREVDPTTLDVWDDRLSQAGARVMARRHATLAALSGETTKVYQQLASSSTVVLVDYRSTWNAAEIDSADGSPIEAWTQALRDALGDARKADMDRRLTTVGPHRDDPVVMLDDREARTHASQGEQRTATLALRLASHRAIEDAIGEPPLLLLDDVFSELDLDRASALAESLPTAQTFLTTARHEEVPVQGRRWQITAGAVL